MSLVDGILTQELDAAKLARHVLDSLDEVRTKVDPETGDLIALMAEGISLGDIAGLGERHREALFQLGCDLMVCCDFKQAETIFLMLALVDPLEARAYYGAGMAMQAAGNLRGAAQLFIQFLALDATNPEGYRRLGECLSDAGELEEAQSAFAAAEALSSRSPRNEATQGKSSRQTS